MTPNDAAEADYPVTTHSQKLLCDEKDGFIVDGNIYVSRLDEDGEPYGGLIGRKMAEPDADGKIAASEILRTTLTRAELLRALFFTPEELRAAADWLESKQPAPGMTMDWAPHSVPRDERFLPKYIVQIVRAEYARQVDLEMIPNSSDYKRAIAAWLEDGVVPGE